MKPSEIGLAGKLAVLKLRLEILKASGSSGKGYWNRWPAGSSKGGEFAPKGSGYGGAGSSYAGMGVPKWLGGTGKPASMTFHEVGGPGWGHYEKPKPPPPGAKPHPKTDDHGKAVTINYPSKPSHSSAWGNGKQSAVFVPGGEAPKSLHGVSMKPWSPPEKGWGAVTGTNPKIDDTFPFEPHPMKSTGAGVLIVEKDGRVWLTKPTNAFGGYQNTYPKGTVESGLTMQQNAIKEAWEETGLKVKITGVLGDYDRDTSRARYYIAERESGTPRDMGWESQAMTLATLKDARTLLNKQHDKDILDDLEDLLSISKKNPASKGGHWQNQPRWPAGSALGGQWKTMGSDGITLPPVIAGGLESKNPSYQKKVIALHAAAQKGDKSAVKQIADGLTPYAEKFAAGQKTSSHTKWFAGVHQYAIQVLHDLDAGVKAQATSDRIKGPEKLSQAFTGKVAEKSKGSNPGAIYQDASGANWLVKGNLQLKLKAVTQAVSDDRARNEILASKLMIAAGVGAPEMKLVDLEGKHEGGLGVASKWVPGTALDPSNKAHIDAMRADYAVHAWLANYDVVGLAYDNTIISADGKAHCIDPGGALLFRAQGTPKGPSHGVIGGALDPKAPELESMRSTNSEQKAIFGGMTQSDLHASAEKLKSISDDTIRTLVKTYGPGDEAAREKLAQSLIDRKNSILERTGHTFQMQAGAVIASSAAPEAPPVAAPVSPASIGGRWTGPTKLVAIQEEATAAGVPPAVISIMSGVLQNPGHYSLQTAKNFANAYATDPDLMGQKEAPYMVAFWRQLVLIKETQGEGLPPSPTTAQTVGAGLTGTAKLEALAQAAKDAGSAAVSDPAAFAVNSVKANSVAEIKSLITYYADEAKLGVAGSKEMLAAWQEALAQKEGAVAPSTQLPPPATGAGLTGKAKLEALLQAAKDAGYTGSVLESYLNNFDSVYVFEAKDQQAHFKGLAVSYSAQVDAFWREMIAQKLGAETKQAQPAASPVGALGAALSNEAKLQSLAHAAVIAGVNETPDYLINLAGADWVTAKQADALAKDATKHHSGPKGEALAAFWNEVSQQKAGAAAKPAAPGATTPVLGPEKLKGLAAAAGNSLSAKAAGLSASEMMSHIQSMTLTEAMQMKQTLSNSPNLPQSGPVVAFYNALLRSKMATVEAAGDAIAAKVSPGVPPVPAFSTGYETSDNYYKKLSQKALDAHAAGDIATLNAMTVKKNGKPAWPTTTVNGKKMQEFYEAVLADATAKKAGGIVAGMQDADAGLSKPATSPPPFAPKVAMPDAKALLLPESNKNAKSHNAKVGLVEKLGQEGDVKGLLSLGFGTNTYSKQQVKLTNDVLAALGSPLKVSTGQKPNTHPALFGNVAADIAAAAAATVGVPMPPKSTVGDVLQAAMQDAVNSSKDWKPTLLPGEKIVEQGESFGVKWAKIETPAKGFTASEIPSPPDFFSNGSQGPTGTWKSTVEALNKANNDAVKSIYDAAISSGGNVEAFKALKFDVIDKATGLPTGQKVDISKHPAAAVKEYFDQIGSELAAQQKVGYKSVQSGSFTGAYSAAAEHLATTHKKVAYEQFKNAQRAADYVVLSKDGASAIPLPQGTVFKEWAPNTGARLKFKEASKQSFSGLTGSEKQAARAYTGSAYDSWNEALRTGATTSGPFQSAQTMVNAFKKAVLDVPEGTILWRGVGVGQSTFESVVGGVIQDGSFNSASYGDRPGGPGESKGTWLRIHIPKTGVKALDATVFSGFGSQEREIIIQNGVRYAILKVQHHPKWTTSAGNVYHNKTIVDVIALPHEP